MLTLSKLLSTIINIMLAAILGYSTIQLFFLFYTVPLNTQIKGKIFHPRIQSEFSPPTINTSTLLSALLFGKPKINHSQMTGQKKTLPETKLNLKLQGIYYSSNSQISRAMIAAKDGKSAAYRIRQSLPNGVILHEIYPKKVILLRNGQYETLRFLKNKKSDKSQFLTKRDKKMRRGKRQSNERPEKLLGNYQRQLQTNPNALIKLIRISPVNQGNRFLGYRLKPGRNAAILSQFNLQTGDILTSVNGVKLDSPLKGLGVIQQLATANQIDLEVLRNGSITSLSFAVEK
ncbi:MAG: type II secretion system protein GspC [Thiomargarita sp.]|nr:type II secretion system protein GspC [Thiomargarita sp.]